MCLHNRKGRWFDETKYLVTESNLQKLMKRCMVCGGLSAGQRTQQQGAYAQFTITCMEPLCCHEQTWETSDVYNQMYIINVLLAAAILYSGGLATKFIRALSLINILSPGIRTFHKIQQTYLHGVSL